MKRIRLTHVKGQAVEREFVHCNQCDRELGMYEIGESPIEPHLCNTKICKMKDETPPPIAELWHEADVIIRLSIPHLDKLTNPDYQVIKGRRPFYIEQLAKCNARLQELRQQLVERCEEVELVQFEKKYNSMRISVIDRDALLDANDLRNLSAACAFWAWELEQREKERKGD